MSAIVAVVAHPDDESLIAGGTLALAAAAGAETGVVSLTRGEHGPIADPALATHATLGDVREAELRAAGHELGTTWTVCLRYEDGGLAFADWGAAAEELAELLWPSPCAILTFGEDGLYGHPDHVAAGEIAGLAVDRLERRSARPVCLYEAAWPAATVPALVAAASAAGLASDFWGIEPALFGSAQAAPTLELDVRDVLAQKLAAVRAHRTQIGPDHLLARLPQELAGRFLGTEPWRLVDRGRPQIDELAELLPGRALARRGAA